MLDLLGGNISAVSGPIGDITQHLPTGKVRILGVSGAKRSRFAPDVPTFVRAGLKDMAHSEWFALLPAAQGLARPGGAAQRRAKSALAPKDVVDGLGTFGLEAMSSSPAELTDLLQARTPPSGRPIVKQIGFTAET